MPHNGLRVRLGAFLGQKKHRDPNIAATIDGEATYTESAPQETGIPNQPKHIGPTEVDAGITYNTFTSDDLRFQSFRGQEIQSEFDGETLISGYHDSGYGGSETQVEPPRWPNPRLSTGRHILTVEGNHIWEAKGPALDVFEEMKPGINDFLKAHTRTISHPLYCVFMTGRTADKARPTVIFYCRNIDRRKDSAFFRDAFKKSGILDRYPGFKSGHSSRPKEYSLLFPQQDFYYSETLSRDTDSRIGTSSEPSLPDPFFLDSCSLPDHGSLGISNASPDSRELQQAEEALEQGSTPTSVFVEPSSSADETHQISEDSVPTLTRLKQWATDRIWPMPDGSQRIWYLCGCNRYTYIDVEEIEAGGIESVRDNIIKSAAAVRGRPNPSQTSDAPQNRPALAIPPPAHSISGFTSTTLPESSTQTGVKVLPSLPTIPAMNTVVPSSAQPRNMHLLVCVGGREFQNLAKVRHVEVANDWNDGMLLRVLLREYEEARQGQQWSISSLLPNLPAKLRKSSLAGHLRPDQVVSAVRDSSIWDLCRQWVPGGGLWAPLHMPSTADFVKFHVFSQAATAEPYPDQFECGQWPSSADPYVYAPVPMRLTTLNIPLWHELKYPGPHLRHQWYNAAAKKLDGRLFDEPFPDFDSIPNIVGYGIRVNERLNEVLILWWCWVAILVTGVLVIMFAYCTGDTSSAFGLGAYLVAALAVYIQLQYAWWKRGST